MGDARSLTAGMLAYLGGLFLAESDHVLTGGASSLRDATDAEITEARRLDSIAHELFARATGVEA